MALPIPSVLLVDDVEANLIALGGVLSDLPCELVRARSGNEALRVLLKKEVALILLDVQMPDMDGFEVASYLQGNAQTKNVPIIFLTAMHQTETSALRGYGSGAVDYLLKPINPEVLRSKVVVFLELYSRKLELAAALEAQQRVSRELERTNEALRHFTQAAAHDLGMPLRSMRGFLEALDEESGARLDDSGRDYLARSRRAAARMSSLLESLLAYAELRKPVELCEVDCGGVVERVCSDLSDRIAVASAQVLAGELPAVQGDPSRIYQLFLNLISNALKFRRPNEAPRVHVNAERRGEEWCFSVEDNGVGIPPECAATVFSAFKRLHSRDEYEGSGLGLAICREVVEQHGGRIWADPEAKRGARFCFTLGVPRARFDEPAPEPAR